MHGGKIEIFFKGKELQKKTEEEKEWGKVEKAIRP